jgi:RNA polymerase sporulation-specific sigma factor
MQDYSDLQTLEDEDLCKASAGGNRDAEGILVSRYLGMVQKLAYQHRGILDFEDLVQEGCIGLLNAIGGFDSERDVQFKSYAYICIRNRIYRALKRAGEACPPIQVPLEDDLPLTGGDPEQLFLGKERLDIILQRMQQLLSPLERKVFLAHLAGLDYQTISCTFHISHKSIDNALQRVKKKLKTIDSV